MKTKEIDLTPIPTAYSGIRFRSKLEAIWALFMDTYRIKWVYEPAKFSLGELGGYIPDFWLPGPKKWLEIKPVNFEGDERHPVFAGLMGTELIVAMGIPLEKPNVIHFMGATGPYQFPTTRTEDFFRQYVDMPVNDRAWNIAYRYFIPALQKNLTSYDFEKGRSKWGYAGQFGEIRDHALIEDALDLRFKEEYGRMPYFEFGKQGEESCDFCAHFEVEEAPTLGEPDLARCNRCLSTFTR